MKGFFKKLTAVVVAAVAALTAFACTKEKVGGSCECGSCEPGSCECGAVCTREEIVEANSAAAVTIVNGQTSGTGIILDADETYAYVATCYHVTGYDATLLVFGQGGEFFGGAETLGYDRQFDVAFFRYPLRGGEKPIMKAAEADPYGVRETIPAAGASVTAVGNALGRGLAATDGIVSVSEELVLSGYFRPVVRVTSALVAGISGGPVVDERGKTFAMAMARDDSGAGVNYALPIGIVLALFEKAKSGSLGAEIERVGMRFSRSETADASGLKVENSVTVSRGENEVTLVRAGEGLKVSESAPSHAGEKVNSLAGRSASATFSEIAKTLILSGEKIEIATENGVIIL